ncbi:MAG: HepT-like ribonuclease domain-containing protein [Chlamydiota bacterium]
MKDKDLFPDLPWKQLIGMRNRLIHAYFDVDHEIIWTTARNKLPVFCVQLESAVSQMETILYV